MSELLSKPPITLIQRKKLARNAVFDLWLDHVRGDHGEDVPSYLVVDPLHKTPDGLTGVGILPVLNDGCLLLHIYRHPVQRWGWEIPRGFLESGESAVEAARRELQEETGYECPADAMLPLGEVTPEPGVINARIMLFAATQCRPSRQGAGEELGRTALKNFTFDQVMTIAGSADLNCGTTMSAIMKYLFLRKKS